MSYHVTRQLMKMNGGGEIKNNGGEIGEIRSKKYDNFIAGGGGTYSRLVKSLKATMGLQNYLMTYGILLHQLLVFGCTFQYISENVHMAHLPQVDRGRKLLSCNRQEVCEKKFYRSWSTCSSITL